MDKIFDKFKDRYEEHQAESMSLGEYLEVCKSDPSAYATTAERMLLAIGEPTLVDTRNDERLSRIFMNRTIKTYPSFDDFYGMESTIEQIVAFFKHAAQGLEERKQILYLLGPVGGGKSSLAERLKQLMEKVPFYALKAGDKVSPLYESPLGLFDVDEDSPILESKYGIPSRYINIITSPWAGKRLREFKGDISKFSVVKIYPSRLNQVGITSTEAGDENNQDISSLVGKVSIRELEEFDQHDPDAYSYSGGLNVTTQGLLEFREMFKASIKTLNPLLFATQDRSYNGTEGTGAMPYQGIVVAHSNESEWQQFKGNSTNEAFIDRVSIVKVPYVLRISDEVRIYEKLLRESSLCDASIAPGTYEMMSQFSVLTRLTGKMPESSNIFSKARVYDGENLKDVDPKAKSLQEYRDLAGVAEGMDGSSTRFAYKILSKAFNHDASEIAANPVHLMYILEKQILEEQYSPEQQEAYLTHIKGILAPKYANFIGDEIQKAYLESYKDYGQNVFDRYIEYADHWLQDRDYRDINTGEAFNREILNAELEKIEKPASIVNPKDFRNEAVQFVLRARANNKGKNPDWSSYQKLRDVIEKKIFASTEELLPVISFSKKKSKEEAKKHTDFVERLTSKGYTEKQVRLLVEWYMRYRKNN